jgi:uncharacterized protein (TIGR03790 family)
VVYNRADPDSQSLAETYAKARSIPPDRLLGIECPITEEITRIEFETKIREPLDQIFVSRGWLKRSETILPNPILGLPDNLPIQQSQDNPIWIMVLMRGVPLKIAEDPTVQAPETLMAQLRPNAAAVDSELALLHFAACLPTESSPIPTSPTNAFAPSANFLRTISSWFAGSMAPHPPSSAA